MGWFNFKGKFGKKEEEYVPERTIRVEAVGNKPAFNQPKKEMHELPPIVGDTVKSRLERMYREEHAGDATPDTRLRSVKERLSELKIKPSNVELPLSPKREEAVVFERKEPSQESLVQAKIDKAMKKIEAVKQKMERTDSYLGLFYDLKAAEKEFNDALEEVNAKGVDLPENFQVKIDSFKAKLTPKKAD